MQLAEMRHHPIAELDHARAAGMIPVRRAAWAERLSRRADGGQHGERIGLGVEHVDGARRARPVARHRHVVAQAGRHRALAGRRCVLVLRPDLEQRGIGQPARLVARARRRSGWAGSTAASCRAWRRSSSAGAGPRRRRRTVRPACAAGTTRSRPRSCRVRPSARRACGTRRCIGVRTGLDVAESARQRRGRDVVEAVHPRHFLDQIGLADDVRTPRRHRGGPRPAAARRRSPAWSGCRRSRAAGTSIAVSVFTRSARSV